MPMFLKKNHLGQAEICGAGEFVGEFVGSSFVGARRRGGSPAGLARFKARVQALRAGGVPREMAIRQAKAELKASVLG